MAELERVIIRIRETLEKSYPLLLKQCGITEDGDTGNALPGFEELRNQILPVIQADEKQIGVKEARARFVQEASFTTLNRLVGLKVMEARKLVNRTYITKSIETGGKSEAHYLYLNTNPSASREPGQGINTVLDKVFKELSQELPQLYDGCRYGFLPRGNDTAKVIDLINSIPDEEWQRDDIIGWVYQYYNVAERKALKTSNAKIDEKNVHIQSQQYTPSWVVKHIVDNTLGRYYLEMYPESQLYEEIEIPIPRAELKREREPKNPEEIKVLDPACGSGNFLLYSFELLKKMYLEQGYQPHEIPALILEHNLYGIDIDDRAVQLTMLLLYLKAKDPQKPNRKFKMNIVSADFHLFDQTQLKEVREKYRRDTTIQDFIDLIWNQLKNARTLGSLLDITGELTKLTEKRKKVDPLFFNEQKWKQTEIEVLEDIKRAVTNNKEYGEFIEQGINFAELLIQKYDVVVANPPYLDSSDMTGRFKDFIKERFKGFDKNLYAAFIKRCADFAAENGYVGMITPQTYMFISSYEKTREWILNENKLEDFVHFGLGGVFTESLVDTAIIVFEKSPADESRSVFFNLVRFERGDLSSKREGLYQAVSKLKNNEPCSYAYLLNQAEFRKIPGYPFVYWISDEIRELFSKYKPLKDYADVVQGLATADNDRFLRFWWEVLPKTISVDYKHDRKKWVPYAKGGPFNKWYGNLWWVVNWENSGNEIKEFVDERGKQKSRPQNESYYFREGLTYTDVSSKGFSLRQLPNEHIFDHAGHCVFSNSSSLNLPLGCVLLSGLVSYLLSLVSGSVHFEVGEMKKIPTPTTTSLESRRISHDEVTVFFRTLFSQFQFSDTNSITLSVIAQDCIEVKKALYSFHIMERDFKHDPLSWGLRHLEERNETPDIKNALKELFIHKAELEARLLINEALNDELVFKAYELLPDELTLTDVLKKAGMLHDSSDEEETVAVLDDASGSNPRGSGQKMMNDSSKISAVVEVLESEGVPPGAYPQRELTDEERKQLKKVYLAHRESTGLDKSRHINGMECGIVEELSSTLKVSPVTVVQEIEKITELPKKAVEDVLHEHIQAIVIEIMRNDYDGILSLSADTGEKSVPSLVIERWREMSLGDNYNEIEALLGKSIQEYLMKDFFKEHSKRFMSRPIVWHLTSDKGSFNFFVLHHIWSHDRLMLLESKYLGDIKRILDSELAAEKDERKRNRLIEKLEELKRFGNKLNELLGGDYQPKVDDGVAKNIAPLQAKGLLKTKVLSDKMITKMLNVDW